MATQIEAAGHALPPLIVHQGAMKFIRDVNSILEMKLILMRRGWYWYLLSSLVFPVVIFYWSRAMAPDDPAALQRVMIGAIIFGVSMPTVGTLAQQMIQDRFQGRFKLLITMPMSKGVYAIGVLLFATMLGAGTLAMLLVFGWLADVDFTLNWVFFPLTAMVILSMAGLPLFIVSYAPSAEAGGVMANLLGVLPVMISPVFFTMEQAPLLLKWIGWVSPMRYAADGITKSLSGQTDVWVELAVLAGFAVTTLGLGIWKLRWREN